MIIFELACAAGHRFEGWFASGEDFDRQRTDGLIACPMCEATDVTKIPHAKIARGDVQSDRPVGPAAPVVAGAGERFHAVAALLQHVLANTEDVGRDFPEEARRIHYEETPPRAIRGVASRAETRELLDEGIVVLPLPVPPKDERN